MGYRSRAWIIPGRFVFSNGKPPLDKAADLGADLQYLDLGNCIIAGLTPDLRSLF